MIYHYGSHIGPSGNRVLPQDLTRVRLRVKPNDWKNKETGEVREGWNAMFVEDTEEIPIDELQSIIETHAIDVSELDSCELYKPCLVRGRISFITSVDTWVITDELVEDLDKNGNIQYERNPNGEYKTLADGMTRIVKMKFKREKDGIGQPLKQSKYGSEGNEPQWIFKVSLLDADIESDNRLSVQFQQTRLGTHHILMDNAALVLEDAATLTLGGAEDPFESIREMWSGKNVYVAGNLINKGEWQGNKWYGINGTFIFDEELLSGHMMISNEPAMVNEPSKQPVPEIVATTYEPVTQPSTTVTTVPVSDVIYEPELQPTRGVPAQPTTTTPSPKPPSATPSASHDDSLLDAAIIRAFGTLGDDIDYDVLMSSMDVGIPEKFKDSTQELNVRRAMSRIRKEHTVVVSNQPKPSEKLTPEKLLATIGAGTEDEIEVITDPDDKKVPPNHIRCACGEIIAFGDIESHICRQK